ncbi:DUF975 family protein [Carnobacterium viridans]|uniref:Uncharacterized membrane protein n=1 Tax=Carnobacterium viridans TaxID=174587 RepID=A0A1H0Y7R6_9LACT|nr:DUF975 family protein [Carnobacterium viridans]UDE95300.1 DUF975 family protein [Carnobacterium viridans]SDQ11187.1 Uncharacterized membrane protein [Carnobacterium viridans]
MERREIKRTAKKLLKGNWKVAILNLIIISVLTGAISQGIFTLIGSGSSFTMIDSVMQGNLDNSTMAVEPTITASLLTSLVSILVSFVSGLLNAGYAWNILDMVDGAKLTIEGMFQTFKKERIFKTTGLIIVTTILIMLWSLLFIIPGIIKSYSYSQALNLMKDNPSISIMEALDQSREMMKGNKWKFFLLQLSFLLWYIVPFVLFGLFTLGSIQTITARLEASPNEGIFVILGFLLAFLAILLFVILISFFIEPYRVTSQQVFYRSLTDSDVYNTERKKGDNQYNEDYEGKQLDDVDF